MSDEKPDGPRPVAIEPTLDLEPTPKTQRLVQILDGYLAELNDGKKPDRQRLLAEYPELAEQLEACLAGIEFMQEIPTDAQGAPKILGDFRILREVGRGGMGAVYEAEQISLRRRVALKILRFGSVSDPEAIQRFQREAETVAALHHTNIVPIFSVGNENGVKYYAMQFISGQSLDAVLKASDRPLDPNTVAEWGLQAAEALAHAHKRDVIHRDVKPSNLLLDESGQIWLTDFGLAKRLDDVTLSMTGALLGTPRYMSPEQASTTTRPIDHRTDIYSLGATLYELATGQPVFAAQTPHGIISQILNEDPQSPRRHRPDLPRDLETILMKCLSKEAGQRYESAKQLADDLRAFLDGRPISARRANVVERAARWVKRQRRSVALTAGAVGMTLLLVLLIVGGGLLWQRSRLAFVNLRTDHPPLVAQLLKDSQPIVPPITVPTQEAMEVPAGNYELELSSNGRLSQTYSVRLERGETFNHKLDLEDQLLWDDVKLNRTYRLATVSEGASEPPVSRTNIIVLDDNGIHCRKGVDGKERWSLNLAEPEQIMLTKTVNLVWPWERSLNAHYNRGLGMFDGRPFVVSSPSSDLNGDGATDLVLAARHQPWLLAVSGVDGKPLWIIARGDADQPRSRNRFTEGNGATVYEPLVIDDQNGDGVADVMALFIHVPKRQSSAHRWIELFSGKSGETVWRYDIPDDYLALKQGEETPYALRWFYGSSSGYSSGGGSRGWSQFYYWRSASNLERTGTHHHLPTRPKMTSASSITFVVSKHVVRLDCRTGEAAVPAPDVGIITGVQPRYGDLDGDGQIDMLFSRRLPDKVVRLPGRPPRNVAEIQLSAWSPTKNAMLWRRTNEARLPQQQDQAVLAANWPIVADLNGDGAAEVLAPDGDSSPVNRWQGAPWGKLFVLEGKTGRPLWSRQLFNSDTQLDFFTAGPDINEDGWREVYVTTLWGREWSLFVDCLSGSDGATLWRAEQKLLNKENEHGGFRLTRPTWYHRGGDGWPQLVVSARVVEGDIADRTCFFSAGTGRLTHIADGVADAQPADLDGDGADDLVLFQRRSKSQWDYGGQLTAFRGVGRETWRRIERKQMVVGDLDGDGVRDGVTIRQRAVTANSGATGKVLWESAVDLGRRDFTFDFVAAAEHDARYDLLPATHDFNGDGAADLLVHWPNNQWRGREPLLAAVSGRTGQTLWKSEMEVQMVDGVPLIECRDLDADGQPEVVLAANLSDRAPRPGSSDVMPRLTVLSGRDGAVRWSKPLTDQRLFGAGRSMSLEKVWLEAAYSDLNGDGVLDIVLPAQNTPAVNRIEMRAVSGADGQTLWRYGLPAIDDVSALFRNAPPAAAGDVDNDGRPEVVVLALAEVKSQDGRQTHQARLTLLDGRTGEPKWRWSTPVQGHLYKIGRGGDSGEEVKNRIRPVLVRRPGGGYWIALLTIQRTYQVHVLNEAGKLVASDVHPDQSKYGNLDWRLWAIDVDGDGGDELLLMREDSLMAVRPNQLDRPLWKRPKGRREVNAVMGLLPDPAAPGRIVVHGGLGDNSLRGIDPRTGEIVWTCVCPPNPTRNGEPRWLKHDDINLLSAPSGQAPPLALFQYDGQSICRQGVLTPRGVGGDTNALAWRQTRRASPVLQPAAYDRRLLRPLPWKPQPAIFWRDTFSIVFWGLFYAVTLVALPWGLILWMVRRRQWGMKTMLLIPVVAGVALMGLMVHGQGGEIQTVFHKLAFAAAVAPAIFTLLWLIRGLWRRRWRRVLTWCAAGVLATLAVIAVVLGVIAPLEGEPLQPGERYSWSGWYWMFLPVFYVLAWGTLIGSIGWWLIRLAVGHIRSLSTGSN